LGLARLRWPRGLSRWKPCSLAVRAEVSKPWFELALRVILVRPDAALSPRRATHLSLASPRESKQREGDPQSGSLRFAAGTLRCSEQTEILETCLLRSLRTSKIFNPSAPALLSPARTGGVRIQIRGALSPLRGLKDATFFIAACTRIYWAVGVNAGEFAVSNSSCIITLAIWIKEQTSPGFAEVL
jgi:hypothetical protein